MSLQLPHAVHRIWSWVRNTFAAIGMISVGFLAYLGIGGQFAQRSASYNDESASVPDSLLAATPDVDGMSPGGGGGPIASINPPVPLSTGHPVARRRAPIRPRAAAALRPVDELMEKLMDANIAFNAPVELERDQAAKIDLYVSPAEAKAKLESLLTGPGTKVSDKIRVSNNVRAHLTGVNFKVDPVTEEEQLLASDGTHWEWMATPTEEGLQSLHLSITAIITVDGHDRRRELRTYDKQVKVRVAPSKKLAGFVGKNWGWVWAVVLAPFLTWFGHRFFRKRQTPGRPDQA